VVLLDKVMKSSNLKNNICSKGHLLLLNRPKGGLEVSIVSFGWSGGRTRTGVTRIRGWRGYALNKLGIARYPIKVCPMKEDSSINIEKQQKPIPRINPA